VLQDLERRMVFVAGPRQIGKTTLAAEMLHFRQDVEGLDLELRYFRDVDDREVDFVVTGEHRC
jgi:predicted AAA+ superfamily ATPase